MIQNRGLTQREQNKLENYLQKFVYKSIQAIVQARIGISQKSSSKASSASHDWFNITLDDIKSVEKEAEKIISTVHLVTNFSLCVEFLLETSDRDRLILETWSMLLKEPRDYSISVTSLYPALSILLRSIISVSRATPAYKLSAQQSSDSYTIHYRLYYGEPQTHVLGEGYLENRIGEVRTQLGTLHINLAYRTKMTISPQKIDLESPFMVKSNYFEPDMSPKRLHAPLSKFGFRVDSGHAVRRRTTDDHHKNGFKEPTVNGHEMNGFAANNRNGQKHFSEDDHVEPYINGTYQDNCGCDDELTEVFKVKGAFAPSTTFPDPSLFPELILSNEPLLNLPSLHSSSVNKSVQDHNADRNANLIQKEEKRNCDSVDYNCNESNEDCLAKMSCSGNSEYGDFVMVDMKPPFAHSDGNNDLGAFYRECQSAPPLASFADQPSLEEQVSDITNQLAMFETSMQDFDTFVDSICQVDANK